MAAFEGAVPLAGTGADADAAAAGLPPTQSVPCSPPSQSRPGTSASAANPAEVTRRQVVALERLARGQEELSAAILSLIESRENGADDANGVDIDLDYTDSWPEVEVSVVINEVLRFDLHDLTFDADFTVFLDWKDEKLRRGDHYQYNAEHAKFELVRTLQHCMDDDFHFFNPNVVIDNSSLDPDFSDKIPTVRDEVTNDDGVDVPWLSKSFHFLGTLSCRHADAHYFPFDLQGLLIRIVCPDMAGVTSLGQRRRVTLSEPKLRPALRAKAKTMGSSYMSSIPSSEVMCHAWKCGSDGSSTLDVGELQVMAMGGSYKPEKAHYDIYIVMRRRWYPRYVFDVFIQNLEVMIACSSIYVPFNTDTLANRLSISLTILLTVVSASGSRPPAVESVPYPTLHDTYAQLMVLCSIFITLGNVAVFQICWGTFRESGEVDRWDSALNMVVSDLGFKSIFGPEACEESSACFGGSVIDCALVYFTLGLLVLALVVCFVKAQMNRISTLLRIKHEVDAPDLSPGKYSRLVLCKYGQDVFEFRPRNDFLAYAVAAGVLPFVPWFWKCWKGIRKLRQKVLRCWNVQNDSFHACDAEALLDAATRRAEEMKKNLPQMSSFHIKLSPFDTFRVMDVGSGEMGFYAYWLDQGMRNVRSSGTADKLKYKKGCTFVDQFITDPNGVHELVDEVSNRFAESLGSDAVSDSPRTFPGSPDEYASPTSESAEHALRMAASDDDNQRPDTAVSIPGRLDETQDSLGSSWGTASSPLGKDALAVSAVAKFKTKGKPLQQSRLTRTGTAGLNKSTVSLEQRRKRKILMCLTGANRQMLRDDFEGRASLDAFVKSVNKGIDVCGGMEIITFSPDDRDEAMYELWATEWVVQHGDLDVGDMKLDKTYRTLKRGQADATATLDEVLKEFADLRAEYDLQNAYIVAGGGDRKLDDEQVEIPASVRCSAFYDAFDANKRLLCALLRARLFAGTISAGSGSSQVTLRSSGSLDTSQVHSIPVGNRTPLVNAKITPGHMSTLFNKLHPRTKQFAEQLLCSGMPAGKCTELQKAWGEDGPVDPKSLETWEQLVRSCCEDFGLPNERRGLFVGISAVFYAAKAAKCDQQILDRDVFLTKLRAKRTQLMGDGGTKGRDLANLTLVIALVESVLHRTARIVCKRNWKVGDADFVATWTLGMYLKHSGVMGVPLQVGSS
eukprot:TRINITY_DN13101_c0_g2_i1.p1 TRINITY_DN13101_c0_g2~~TRINITY_DN13101_c0_g2_i1.p1  ORF type:complete len:1186 (+),score=269.39 TRINITY_DN13101_c0_g2_i1:291-3848(+)